MLENGHIKEFRSLLTWEWFKDPYTAHLFEYLRLACNWKPGSFKGKTIERGQLVTSIQQMALATGLSQQSVRTALNHLKSTGEITSEPTNKFTLITVVKYSDFQGDTGVANTLTGTQVNRPLTGKQQTTNNQLTTIEESKKARKQESKKKWSVPLPPDADKLFSQDLLSALTDWLTYKHERSEDYKPTGLRNLLSEIQNKAGEHGGKAVCDVIRLSMSNNWRGIIWDRLVSQKTGAASSHEPSGEMEQWEIDWLAEIKARKENREGRDG